MSGSCGRVFRGLHYDFGTFCGNKDHRTSLVRDGGTVNAGQFRVEVLSVPGHSADSAMFKLDRLLFTGNTLTAGLIGKAPSSYGAATQVNALRGKILSLPGIKKHEDKETAHT